MLSSEFQLYNYDCTSCSSCFLAFAQCSINFLLLIFIQTIGELQRSISAARHRVNKISVLKAALEKKMSDNAVELDRVESEVKSALPAAAESLSQVKW